MVFAFFRLRLFCFFFAFIEMRRWSAPSASIFGTTDRSNIIARVICLCVCKCGFCSFLLSCGVVLSCEKTPNACSHGMFAQYLTRAHTDKIFLNHFDLYVFAHARAIGEALLRFSSQPNARSNVFFKFYFECWTTQHTDVCNILLIHHTKKSNSRRRMMNLGPKKEGNMGKSYGTRASAFEMYYSHFIRTLNHSKHHLSLLAFRWANV